MFDRYQDHLMTHKELTTQRVLFKADKVHDLKEKQKVMKDTEQLDYFYDYKKTRLARKMNYARTLKHENNSKVSYSQYQFFRKKEMGPERIRNKKRRRVPATLTKKIKMNKRHKQLVKRRFLRDKDRETYKQRYRYTQSGNINTWRQIPWTVRSRPNFRFSRRLKRENRRYRKNHRYLRHTYPFMYVLRKYRNKLLYSARPIQVEATKPKSNDAYTSIPIAKIIIGNINQKRFIKEIVERNKAFEKTKIKKAM